jgi:hypothetical protein
MSKVPGKASLASDGRPSAKAAKIWATPSVATVRISRGAWAKRRMMRNSTSAPSSAATTSPRPRLTK